MLRIVLAALGMLFWATSASAVSCPPSPTNTVLVVAPVNCIISAQGLFWQFGGLHNGVGPAYDINAGGSSPPNTFFNVGDAIGRVAGNFFFRQANSCGEFWQHYITAGINAWYSSFGGFALNYFTDVTGGVSYASFALLLNAAAANDSLSVQPIPSAYGACWAEGVGTTQWKNGLTLNLATNFSMAGSLDVLANGISITGDGTPTVQGQIRFRDTSSNPTVSGVNIKPVTNATNCGPVGSAGSGLLSGNGNGTVTYTNVIIQECGGGGAGQDHNVYASAAIDGDVGANVQITGLTSLNVHGGGWLVKLRPGGQNATNSLTQLKIGCTITSCIPNGALDIPCGGNYNVGHFVIQNGVPVYVSSQQQWYVVRIGEEIPYPQFSASCDTTNAPPNASNVLVFDTGWFIWDGPCPGAAVAGRAILVCPGGSACNLPSVPGWAPTITVKNSKIVSDPLGCNFNNSLGPGVTDGGGNTFYASRTLAGLAPWPALPAIP